MKNLFVSIFFITVFVGCAASGGKVDYQKASTTFGVEESVLKESCKDIYCNYDNLKDRLEVSADDFSSFLAFGGDETRTIEYSWSSGRKDITISLFDVYLYGSWRFDEYAEVYIGKEMVAKVDAHVDRTLANYNEVATEHWKREKVSGRINFDLARRIALEKHENVTIRFYGKNGYNDKVLPREHDLIKVVKLAELGI